MTRNIGIKVKAPKEEPKEGDKKNPPRFSSFQNAYPGGRSKSGSGRRAPGARIGFQEYKDKYGGHGGHKRR